METRFSHLIEFDSEFGLTACENVIKLMDKEITFDHDDVIESYSREDGEYYITMHFQADWCVLGFMETFLSKHGFEGHYDIYQRLTN